MLDPQTEWNVKVDYQNFERVKSEAAAELNDETEIEEDIYSDNVDINDFKPAKIRKSPISTLLCFKLCSGNVRLYTVTMLSITLIPPPSTHHPNHPVSSTVESCVGSCT